MPTTSPRSRRQRYRDETLAEVRAHAMRQLAEGGPPAVSLNAIAKAMGMTGPAMYRYVDSRDALLADLVVAAYDELADALARAAAGAPAEPADARLRALATAFRDWALDAPERYLLTFGAPTGSGGLAPDRIVPAVQQAMRTILEVMTPLVESSTPGSGPEQLLADQLDAWAESRDDGGVDLRVARLGFAAWTRLHGVVSLELGGHLGQTGIDPGLLYESEVTALVAEATGRPPGVA